MWRKLDSNLEFNWIFAQFWLYIYIYIWGESWENLNQFLKTGNK